MCTTGLLVFADTLTLDLQSKGISDDAGMFQPSFWDMLSGARAVPIPLTVESVAVVVALSMSTCPTGSLSLSFPLSHCFRVD